MKPIREYQTEYTVFWVGGERDGEEIYCSSDLNEAMNFAENFENEHEKEFDPFCGGVAIFDETGSIIEW